MQQVELSEGKSPGIQAAPERPERLADLLTLSYEPMLAWSLDGPIEFWNAGAERLYGFAPNEAVGRSSHALLQTKFPIEFTELRSQLQNERYWSGELRHICKDGHEVLVDSRMQLLGDDTVLEVNRDVTEVKTLAARQATLVRDLSTAAAKFEALFNQSGIFAGIMDLQGYLREANDLALDMVRVYKRASSGPAVLGHPLVAWLRRDEGEDSLCDGSSCFGITFSAKSFDTGWPTAASASWTLRCIPSATARGP